MMEDMGYTVEVPGDVPDGYDYAVGNFLEQWVLDDCTEEDIKQFKVLMGAIKKFHERDAKHRGLWRYFGSMDSAFQLRAKGTRVYNIAIQLLRRDGTENRPDEDTLDDAFDAINYAAFFVRNVKEGRFGDT